MDFNNVNFKFNNVAKIQKNKSNNYNINFKSADMVTLSDVAREKSEIIKSLKNAGFNTEKIDQLIAEYFKKGEYSELTQGDKEDGFVIHFADLGGRHLTPAEAIVYQAFNMNDYYMQYQDEIPRYHEQGCIEAQSRDIGTCNFSPLELAKLINQGFDIVMAGMILKEEIDAETAKKVQKYYDKISTKYDNSHNVKEAEYEIDLLSQNIDLLEDYTDGEKSKKLGLIRPLTTKEAADIIYCSSPADISSVNHYIQINQLFGYSIASMDIYELWDKSTEEIIMQSQAKAKTVSLKAPQYFTDLQDKINYIKQRDKEHADFYEDLSALDSKKFLKKLPISTIMYDGRMSVTCHDRQLRQKNIQIFNLISDELIDKMTRKYEDREGHFAFIYVFLNTPDFDERVANLEYTRIHAPKTFEAMTREEVLDYLSNTTLHQESSHTISNFTNMLEGGSTDFMREDSKTNVRPLYILQAPDKNN